MVKHQTRVIAICALAAVSLISLAVASYLEADAKVLASIVTAAGIFVPAAADALAVEKRRREPGVAAIVDDVIAAVSTAETPKSNNDADSDTRDTD